MPGKRKRAAKSVAEQDPCKRSKMLDKPQVDTLLEHPVLSLYYPQVRSLREHLLHCLPSESKSRRRKIRAVPNWAAGSLVSGQARDFRTTQGATDPEQRTTLHEPQSAELQNLSWLLDTTVVGASSLSYINNVSRERDPAIISQQCCTASGNSGGYAPLSQPEIVDFCVWLLSENACKDGRIPQHLLYQGAHPRDEQAGNEFQNPNTHVKSLKSRVWQDVLQLLGKDGDQIMQNLLIDCGIYLTIKAGRENLYQLSGLPLSDMTQLPKVLTSVPLMRAVEKEKPPAKSADSSLLTIPRSPSAIIFVRNHALNRYPSCEKLEHTFRLLCYIFPLQFGLHNVFTFTVDPRKSAQPFKDYTLREHEISQRENQVRSQKQTSAVIVSALHHKVPKRLRGLCTALIRKIQKLHRRCSYHALLMRYCPLDLIDGMGWSDFVKTQIVSRKRKQQLTSASGRTLMTDDENPESNLPVLRRSNLIDAANPSSQVSAFCRAAIFNILPQETWGIGLDGETNREIMLKNIDTFVHLRRFESISLHTVSQNLKLNCIKWLAPPNAQIKTKASKQDMEKRKEMFLELIYYVFDSILIPLIRSNFHVTESSQHRNRVFYFRHDVWRALTDPSVNHLKTSMLSELERGHAREVLSCKLRFSQIRLLPKGPGVRPIMNLRRRITKIQSGKPLLDKSINSELAPVQSMLNYEKSQQPSRLGSSLFSVGDLYAKLRDFRNRILLRSRCTQRFFFAKVDVQSCFDTIPQDRLLNLLGQLVSRKDYQLANYVEVSAPDLKGYSLQPKAVPKAVKKFRKEIKPVDGQQSFEEVVKQDLAKDRRGRIFIDKATPIPYGGDKLFTLLVQHVRNNLVKIGKKFYRQKQGIPQGSVLSSLLCSFFYADFESQHLDFLQSSESLLLRLIDDFLVITTNKNCAEQFLQVMHSGNERYGLKVNPAKSFVNFEANINDYKIQKVPSIDFAYCGLLINTKSLELTRDRERRKGVAIADSLTIDVSKVPGRALHRKALNALKSQTQAMLTDTSYNTHDTVLLTLYLNFMECAMKLYRYCKSLSSSQRPASFLLVRTVQDTINLAFVLIKSRSKRSAVQGYQCDIGRGQIRWLAASAFRRVLGLKQSSYGAVLGHLDRLALASQPQGEGEMKRLWKVVREGDRVFGGYKF